MRAVSFRRLGEEKGFGEWKGVLTRRRERGGEVEVEEEGTWEEKSGIEGGRTRKEKIWRSCCCIFAVGRLKRQRE